MITKLLRRVAPTIKAGRRPRKPFINQETQATFVGDEGFGSSEECTAAVVNPDMVEVRADVAKFNEIRRAIMLGKSP